MTAAVLVCFLSVDSAMGAIRVRRRLVEFEYTWRERTPTRDLAVAARRAHLALVTYAGA